MRILAEDYAEVFEKAIRQYVEMDSELDTRYSGYNRIVIKNILIFFMKIIFVNLLGTFCHLILLF